MKQCAVCPCIPPFCDSCTHAAHFLHVLPWLCGQGFLHSSNEAHPRASYSSWGENAELSRSNVQHTRRYCEAIHTGGGGSWIVLYASQQRQVLTPFTLFMILLTHHHTNTGIYTGDVVADDSCLFVTKRHTFSDLVEGLSTPCTCGMSRNPWNIEPTTQVYTKILNGKCTCT